MHKEVLLAFLDLVLAPKCHDRVTMQEQFFYYNDVSDVIICLWKSMSQCANDESNEIVLEKKTTVTA